jgi:O-acetyl-ADP-ribose deacetylase (regulator of RNase III)
MSKARWLPDRRSGAARITAGYNLLAPWIIHTVGPVWKGGDRGEATLLASCYANSLRLAIEHSLRTVAFPAISTGAYAYPLRPAAVIAIDTARELTRQETTLEEVIFCCYSGEDFAIYKKLLETVPDRHKSLF